MVQLLTTDPTLSDFDLKWSGFIKSKVNSFTKWDLLRFFYDNPHTFDTADNIAQYIGREVQTVQAALEGLVRSGLIDKETRGQASIFRLSQQPEMRQALTDFIKACHNREFRARAIHLVIQSKSHA
ncbi:MarR family transcriptional regulator [Aggregatilineales bacterium SYSU G02658]